MAEIIDGMVLLAQALVPLAKATVPPVLAPAPKTRGFPLTLPAAPRCEISVGNLKILQPSLAMAYFAYVIERTHLRVKQVVTPIQNTKGV